MTTNLSKTNRGPENATDFVIGKDNFDDLEFNPAMQPRLRHIYNKAKQKPVKQFVLADRPRVAYVCRVTLIEKGDRFTPRLAFSVRDKSGQISNEPASDGADNYK